MNAKKRKRIKANKLDWLFTFLFILIILIISSLSRNHYCKVLKHSVPTIVAQSKRVFYLYGGKIRRGTSSGYTFSDLTYSPDILFIVTDNYSDIDINNLKSEFLLKGKFMKSTPELHDFFKKIRDCKGYDTWRNNIYVEIKEDGTILKIIKI